MAVAAATRGAAYEMACLHTLTPWLSMRLHRTGGAGDRGIDLQGWWDVPQVAQSTSTCGSVRVLVQCKAEKKAIGPSVVRELEGTTFRAICENQGRAADLATSLPASSVTTPVLGLLASFSGFSKQAILHARSSRVPLLLLHLCTPSPSIEETERLTCRGFVWNDALAGPQGLLRGRYEAVWTSTSPTSYTPSRLSLYCDGIRVA
ncbi:hypothetical protein ACI68E_004016 [Malassezia pachydermatis]|uniref:Restriction endonuclease type IV Mrr domain-containing protein n=1 Tax=Malassezia pachydermatis TaxID=77020 RepID=A0A0M9VMR9_9BASI|nr:hypothetical protein Malapachy_2850 [Malassezia pachydermatis]KOS12562.1 hypothetical protein Malapachy_2850 [Malassezia pachydermatis]